MASAKKGKRERLIEVRDLSFYYGSRKILDKVSFSLHKNDFLAIIGPNGGGKTTLIKLIVGLLKPADGTIRLLVEKSDIGYVPQKVLFDINMPITVFDVVLMGRFQARGMFRRYTKDDFAAAENALKMVAMLDYKDTIIGNLSGGQQQRVFIARAIVNNPKVLILDEPMAGVDEKMQKDFYNMLKEFNKNMAIIMITHDLTAVSVYVNRIACLNRKMFYHDDKTITKEELDKTYNCPVELIAHGVPHIVLGEHK